MYAAISKHDEAAAQSACLIAGFAWPVLSATETGTGTKRPFTVNSQRERFAEYFECAGAAAILLFPSRL